MAHVFRKIAAIVLATLSILVIVIWAISYYCPTSVSYQSHYQNGHGLFRYLLINECGACYFHYHTAIWPQGTSAFFTNHDGLVFKPRSARLLNWASVFRNATSFGIETKRPSGSGIRESGVIFWCPYWPIVVTVAFLGLFCWPNGWRWVFRYGRRGFGFPQEDLKD